MEKLILQTLNNAEPTPAAEIMRACKVKMSEQIGVLTDAERDFLKMLRAIEQKGTIMLKEGEGWVKV